MDIFRARIIDIAPRTLVVEATGDREKLDAIIGMLRPHGIKEIAPLRPVAMARGQGVLANIDDAAADRREDDDADSTKATNARTQLGRGNQ